MGKRGAVATRAKRTSGKTVVVSSSSLSPSPGMTAEAKKCWRQLVGAFPTGHFTEADRLLLEQFCESAAIHREATKALDKDDRYYWDDKGVRRKHPAVDDQHQARCDCAMLATKLRITKQAMISPKAAGRAAHDAAGAAATGDEFGGLLFGESEMRQ